MGDHDTEPKATLISIQLLLTQAQQLSARVDAELLTYVIAVATLECQEQLKREGYQQGGERR